MIAKYGELDAQLQGVTFELPQMCVNEKWNVKVARIMSGANHKMKNNHYQ